MWPRTCAVSDCGRPSDRHGSYICSHCYATLPWHDESDSSAFAYLEPVSQLINIFKDRGAVHLTADFAGALELSFRKKHDASCVDAVFPVPLHPRRLSERGYNPAGLLARAFAKRINRVCDETSLVRIRDTEHQSRLSAEERRKNPKGAFRAKDASMIKGRTIVLIDDVATTGTTMNECAKALYAGGAHKVIQFALAKALMDEDQENLVF